LIFSEYLEGLSNNKALEIYNGTGADIDLSNYKIELFSNGVTTPSSTLALSGTLASGQTYVICHTKFGIYTDGGIEDPGAFCALRNGGVMVFNGDDGLELLHADDTLVDSFGAQTRPDGGSWNENGVSTVDHDLRRKCSVTQGDTDFDDAFDPSVEWDEYAPTDYSDLGQYVCP
jgi:predicted extracellular nuclease